MVAISSRLVNPANAPVIGVEVFIELTDGFGRPVRGWRNNDEVVSSVSTITDESGQWSANLFTNASIIPANTAYMVTERYANGYRHSYLFVLTSGMTVPAEGLIESLDPLQSTAFQLHLADTDLHAAGSKTPISTDAPLPLGTANSGSTTAAAGAGHVHPPTGLALVGHSHDSNYYTEAEVDSFLSLKSNTDHTHSGGTAGVSDHGALTGLNDDDHTQYALANGARGDFASTNHTHPGVSSQDLAVGDNVLPPGFYFEYPSTIDKIVGVVNVAPQGSNLVFDLVDNGSIVGSVTIAAGSKVGAADGLEYAVAAGSILKVNVTQVGSTTPGQTLEVYLVGAGGGTGGGTHADSDHSTLAGLEKNNIFGNFEQILQAGNDGGLFLKPIAADEAAVVSWRDTDESEMVTLAVREYADDGATLLNYFTINTRNPDGTHSSKFNLGFDHDQPNLNLESIILRLKNSSTLRIQSDDGAYHDVDVNNSGNLLVDGSPVVSASSGNTFTVLVPSGEWGNVTRPVDAPVGYGVLWAAYGPPPTTNPVAIDDIIINISGAEWQ